jgi:hopanoid biosynthesis associated protein HpnK
LAHEDIAAITDAGGRLDENLARAGVRYFFLPSARRQLAAEIRAQFEAFAKTGLPLDHVNAHNHMHIHPTVLSLIIGIGRDYGLRAVRLPRPPRPPGGGLLAPWIARMRRQIHRAGLVCNDRLLGWHHTGRMDRERVLSLLAGLPEGSSEIMFHPATGTWGGADPAPPGDDFVAEYEALCDPAVAEAVEAAAARLSAFRDLS